MLALCTEKPKPIAQTTFRRAIKLQITETSPCARVSRKAVCGPETKTTIADMLHNSFATEELGDFQCQRYYCSKNCEHNKLNTVPKCEGATDSVCLGKGYQLQPLIFFFYMQQNRDLYNHLKVMMMEINMAQFRLHNFLH